jgi:hypothetical protein
VTGIDIIHNSVKKEALYSFTVSDTFVIYLQLIKSKEHAKKIFGGIRTLQRLIEVNMSVRFSCTKDKGSYF